MKTGLGQLLLWLQLEIHIDVVCDSLRVSVSVFVCNVVQ